jgi:hypothetical protein
MVFVYDPDRILAVPYVFVVAIVNCLIEKVVDKCGGKIKVYTMVEGNILNIQLNNHF